MRAQAEQDVFTSLEVWFEVEPDWLVDFIEQEMNARGVGRTAAESRTIQRETETVPPRRDAA